MSENCRLFKHYRSNGDLPIFVRNATKELIEIKFTYDGDFNSFRNHPLKDWRTLRFPPGQLINLRYFLSEEPLYSNLHLDWHIYYEKLIVEGEHYCWDDYPEKCEEMKPLYEEARLISRMNNDRWRAIQATKERSNELSSN